MSQTNNNKIIDRTWTKMLEKNRIEKTGGKKTGGKKTGGKKAGGFAGWHQE
jgi:hypothetical protein